MPFRSSAQRVCLRAPAGSLTLYRVAQALDLEGNALADWGEVARLAPLPALTRLSLGGNGLARVAYPPSPRGAPAARLRFGARARHERGPLPQAFSPQVHALHALAGLGLRGCPQDWTTRLAPPVPLLLDFHCRHGPGAARAGGAPAFAALRALLLGDNALAAWADVQALDAWPALSELRLSGNPVLRGAAGGGRYEVPPHALPPEIGLQ